MSSAARKRPRQRAKGSSPPPLAGLLGEPSSALFPSRGELLKVVAVVVIASVVVALCNNIALFFNRQPKPFCDSSTGEGSSDIVSDYCVPCPDNGHCFGGKLECFTGFKAQGRKCVEDEAVSGTAGAISKLLQDQICDAYARVLCNEAGKIWFQEDDIINIINEHLTKDKLGWKLHTINFTKHRALEAAENTLETRTLVNGSKEFKCPELLAELHKSLKCKAYQWILKNALVLFLIFCVIVGSMIFLMNLRQKRNALIRAEQLYEEVCEVLEENAIKLKSGNSEGEPWLVASWLRDHLLLPRERKNTMLWKKVEELILEDSRIAQYPKLIKGESKVVFEWQDYSSPSSKLKEKRSAIKLQNSRKRVPSSNVEETTGVNQHKVADERPVLT